MGYSRSKLPAAGFSAPLCTVNQCSYKAARGLRQSTLRRTGAQAAQIQPLVWRQNALRVKRHDVVVIILFFIARHHIPQNTFPGRERQYGKTHPATGCAESSRSLHHPDCRFRYGGNGFHQSGRSSLPRRATPPSSPAGCIYAATTGALHCRARLMADPDIRVRRAALPNR